MPHEYSSELIAAIRETSRVLGYAICIHGSQSRDLDMVAVPWVIEASSAEEMAQAVIEAVKSVNEEVFVHTTNSTSPDGTKDRTYQSPEPKPHGRKAWSIYLHINGPYIDLSVMPRLKVTCDRCGEDTYGPSFQCEDHGRSCGFCTPPEKDCPLCEAVEIDGQV